VVEKGREEEHDIDMRMRIRGERREGEIVMRPSIVGGEGDYEGGALG